MCSRTGKDPDARIDVDGLMAVVEKRLHVQSTTNTAITAARTHLSKADRKPVVLGELVQAMDQALQAIEIQDEILKKFKNSGG